MSTRWLLSILAPLIAVVLVACAGTSARASTPVNDDGYSAVLTAGHCLKTSPSLGVNELESRSGRFQLFLFDSGQLTLHNEVEFSRSGLGYPMWDAYVPNKLGHRSSLCLTASGDLVLRKDSHRVWHTKTAGEAAGGDARLTDGGRLVVLTTEGRVVWSSRTTAVLLVRGDRLRSGASLMNRLTPASHTRVWMRRNGNLVVQRGHRTVWQTSTHVRGSELLVTSAGRLAVRTPHGRTVWRSPSKGKDAYLEVAQAGRLLLGNIHHPHCWVRPVSNHECD